MTERKWTAGPWEVRYSGGETQLTMGDGKIHMCDMTYYPWVPENLADWHLIAAAPDLYEALSECKSWIEKMHPEGSFAPKINAIMEKYDTALAKARGEHQ